MTTVSTDVQQFGPEVIWHTYNRPLGYGTLKIGDGEGRVALFFNDTATIDAMVTHLAELKTEMIAARQAAPADDAWQLTAKGVETADAQAVTS